jgi:hypothetical protein
MSPNIDEPAHFADEFFYLEVLAGLRKTPSP